MIRFAAFVVVAACGNATLAPSTAPEPPKLAFDPKAKLALASEDVAFGSGGLIPGTIVRPTAAGKYPAVVMLPGSGPTDRDWNSTILSTNASGKQLAESIASHGAVVLRFDKAKVGANKEPVTADTTMDIYRDEARAALALLRARHDVDPALMFVAGNSEGAYHAIRTALVEGHALAGILLLSGSSRPLAKILLAQIDAQLKQAMPDQADAIHAALQQALDDTIAGKPVDPTKVTTIPALQAVLRGVTNPEFASLSRTLLAYDPLPDLAKLDIPVFVFNGEKDVQVDPELDAKVLAAANPHATLFLAPDANHVLQHEATPKAQLVMSPKLYSQGTLDPATADAIAQWIALTISKR